MPASITGSLTTTGSVTLTKPQTDTSVVAVISGTYGTVTFVFEGTVDGTNWFPLVAVAAADGSVATSTISPTDDTERAWTLPAGGLSGVRLRATAVGSGSLDVSIQSEAFVSPSVVTASTSSNTASGTTNITSSSATAFTVGLNGTTTPVFVVDDSVSSAAVGVKIVGRAAAAGASIVVISGTTNEPLTIDAKGSGALSLNNTGTGTVNIGAGGGGMTLTDVNIVLTATTGTKIGTATTQKLGFYNLTPVVQPAASTNGTTGTTGASTGVSLDTTFTGGSGSSAFTIGGVVLRLKQLGLLAT